MKNRKNWNCLVFLISRKTNETTTSNSRLGKLWRPRWASLATTIAASDYPGRMRLSYRPSCCSIRPWSFAGFRCLAGWPIASHGEWCLISPQLSTSVSPAPLSTTVWASLICHIAGWLCSVSNYCVTRKFRNLSNPCCHRKRNRDREWPQISCLSRRVSPSVDWLIDWLIFHRLIDWSIDWCISPNFRRCLK